MFRKTIFGHFMDVKSVFNGLLCHHILLREVEDEPDDIISFKSLSQKVSFDWEDFDTVTRLRARSRHPIQLDTNKALSDEEVVKMSLFYFIELAMKCLFRTSKRLGPYQLTLVVANEVLQVFNQA
ncbi:Ulp1-like peptidase [Cucumis melo var. makuwa]|uniref:Ulp1-like peptidase n=1 Tax=Cucumis melo var. makuwa TaxID=1194695 RepID=A0A5A7V8G7_CUCMM|nr:Ulp1-like peptidase [Cucumis melo var. makuwa]